MKSVVEQPLSTKSGDEKGGSLIGSDKVVSTQQVNPNDTLNSNLSCSNKSSILNAIAEEGELSDEDITVVAPPLVETDPPTSSDINGTGGSNVVSNGDSSKHDTYPLKGTQHLVGLMHDEPDTVLVKSVSMQEITTQNFNLSPHFDNMKKSGVHHAQHALPEQEEHNLKQLHKLLSTLLIIIKSLNMDIISLSYIQISTTLFIELTHTIKFILTTKLLIFK